METQLREVEVRMEMKEKVHGTPCPGNSKVVKKEPALVIPPG